MERNYICKKCWIIVQKDGNPLTSGCSSSSKNHAWYDLGIVGDKTFKCQKCDEMVKSKGNPNTGNCKKGGDHQWRPI